MRAKLILVLITLYLAGINAKIYSFEHQLKNGIILYLELAPVDPRSLMQGDYMRLRFAVASQLEDKVYAGSLSQATLGNGFNDKATIYLDEKRIGWLSAPVRSHETNESYDVAYQVRNGRVKFATDAFYFEEGTAERYQQAKFGRFRVNKEGGLLLEALVDQDLNLIMPQD